MNHHANANIGPTVKGANVAPYSHANVAPYSANVSPYSANMAPSSYVSPFAKGKTMPAHAHANVGPASKVSPAGKGGYGPLAANAKPYGVHAAGSRYTSTGEILVLFILLVIITRSKFNS